MQIWFKMDLIQSHLRTFFQIFSIVNNSFSFNRAETSSFAHSVQLVMKDTFFHEFAVNSLTIISEEME
jgi:hypothetical protein